MGPKTPHALPRPRPLEGPGSEVRLRRLQQRFARLHRAGRAATAKTWWTLAAMCAATFAATVVLGLLATRLLDGAP